MTRTERFVRRNRVDERAAIAIAVAAGILAATAGARPTGQTVLDWVFVGVAVGAVVWAAASAPWWALAGATGTAAVIAFDPLVAVVAAAAFGLGLYIGIRQRDQSSLRALVAAVAMNALIRSELDGFLGLSAIISVAVGAMLFVAGLLRRPSRIRRIGWITLGAVGAVAAVGLIGTALAAVTARPDLTRATSGARHAIDAVNAGDYQAAAELFDSSSRNFANADRRLGGALTAPALLIPGVAQNVTAGSELSAAAAQATSDAADALRSVDPATLRVVDGAIDIDAIRAIEEPLAQVSAALDELRVATDSVDSPWLLGRLRSELDELDAEFDDNQPRLDTAIEAVRLAPQLLGADGERRYLLLFTSPVEARGIAGFIGNYAEITVTDGRIEVTDFGRRSELDDYLLDNPATCAGCSQEVLDRYGDFGLDSGPDGGVIPKVWTNLTMPASFPNVAEPAQILYPQSGGEPIDGVIVVDPYVIAALMTYTGPIAIPELGVTVAPETAAEFILRDQYRLTATDDAGIDNDTRVDALQTLGQGVIQAILTGSLPEPSQLARDLGPLAAEHRLMVWTDDPAEQQLLADTGLLGAMPELGPDGGFSVVVANTGESKIDAFLERTTDVRIDAAPDGSRELVATVKVRNGAPSSGLPRYVIGNGYGLPAGSSRLRVNFFGPPTLTSITRDGEAITAEQLPEAGWMGYATDVTLGSGETTEYELRFALDPARGGDAAGTAGAPVEWVQPLAIRDE